MKYAIEDVVVYKDRFENTFEGLILEVKKEETGIFYVIKPLKDVGEHNGALRYASAGIPESGIIGKMNLESSPCPYEKVVSDWHGCLLGEKNSCCLTWVSKYNCKYYKEHKAFICDGGEIKASEMLKSITCTPEGKVCMKGSDGDRKVMQEAIAFVEKMEKRLSQLESCELSLNQKLFNGKCKHVSFSKIDHGVYWVVNEKSNKSPKDILGTIHLDINIYSPFKDEKHTKGDMEEINAFLEKFK